MFLCQDLSMWLSSRGCWGLSITKDRNLRSRVLDREYRPQGTCPITHIGRDLGGYRRSTVTTIIVVVPELSFPLSPMPIIPKREETPPVCQATMRAARFLMICRCQEARKNMVLAYLLKKGLSCRRQEFTFVKIDSGSGRSS